MHKDGDSLSCSSRVTKASNKQNLPDKIEFDENQILEVFGGVEEEDI